MVYEVKQSEVTQEQWDEMKKITRENVCSECGAELQIHTVPDRGTLAVGCLNKEHHGYMERTTYTQAFRRGELVHPAIEAAIQKKMLPKSELGRAMNLLALRYPDAIKDPATAALFIYDCARLDLDPLIQPAEAVPVAFKSHKILDGKEQTLVTIQMIITEDGWLSMAARGCQEEWNGPPHTMRLEEYLTTLDENKGKSREEILSIAKEIKKSACKDEDAYYYVAIGRSKTMLTDALVPGWFTKRDLEKAEKAHLPAASEPGNQARVRAIKKWVRHVYPECRKKMMALTSEWMKRAEDIQAATQFIDAEYSLLSMPEGDEKTGATTELKLGEAEVGATVLSSPQGEKIPPSVPAPTLKRDPTTIRTITDLYKACNQDFKLQPNQVLAELGVNSQTELTETPAQCYQRIAAVRT